MRGARALAATTAVLKHCLEASLSRAQVEASLGGPAVVSALPPDRIATGGDEAPRLNLFLYQVTPNLAWRRDGDGGAALDLHYLLSAYGAGDLHGELLIGHALEVLRPLRAIAPAELRAMLAEALVGESLRELAPALAPLLEPAAPPAITRVEVALQFLPLEELSRLWSAFQARYRPSAALKVSLVYT